MSALERMKKVVEETPKGFRGPPSDLEPKGSQRLVEVLADDVAELARVVEQPDARIKDLLKGCTHPAALGQKVGVQSDDVHHLIESAGGKP